MNYEEVTNPSAPLAPVIKSLLSSGCPPADIIRSWLKPGREVVIETGIDDDGGPDSVIFGFRENGIDLGMASPTYAEIRECYPDAVPLPARTTLMSRDETMELTDHWFEEFEIRAGAQFSEELGWHMISLDAAIELCVVHALDGAGRCTLKFLDPEIHDFLDPELCSRTISVDYACLNPPTRVGWGGTYIVDSADYGCTHPT